MATDRGWRYELKMSCGAAHLAQARTWIRLHYEGFRTAYPPRIVNNLYLDTSDMNSLNANMQGVGTRQKLRLRWYGRLSDSIVRQPVLELKYKDNMLGNKKQEELDCDLDLQRPYRRLLQTIQQAASPSWQQWLSVAAQPALINQYHREYYVTQDGEIRATLDYHLRVFDQRYEAHPNLIRPVQLPQAVIIEVKCAPNQAPRLESMMGAFPLPRVRYSKYVNGLLAGTF